MTLSPLPPPPEPRRRTMKPFFESSWENIHSSTGERQLPFFKPHYIFETLRDQRPQTFAASICPGEESVAGFWRECGDHRRRRADHRNLAKKKLFISWRSLLCRWTSSRKQHHLICPVWSEHLVNTRQGNTVDASWKQICDRLPGWHAGKRCRTSKLLRNTFVLHKRFGVAQPHAWVTKMELIATTRFVRRAATGYVQIRSGRQHRGR